jgi:C4-dicarboxylate-specific signal transduction histidine kinase
MSQATVSQRSRYRPSRQTVAYALAVVLPITSWAITTRVNALHGLPMSLHFLSMALIATFGGFGPAFVAVFISILTRIYQVFPEPHTRALVHGEFLRSAVLVCGALIISFMTRRRRISSERLELTLGELQDRTDALVESLNSSKCACWTLDFDGDGHVRWYGGSYPIFGRPFSEFDGLRDLTPLLHPEDQSSISELAEHMQSSNDPIICEFRVPWPNGELHWLEMRGNRIPGEHRVWRGVTLDITERKMTEAALLRSEKLAAMGRLASTVAHEINNPLEAVTNLLYLASADDSLDHTTRSYVSMAERELARLGNITRLTLGFVRTSSDTMDVEIAEHVDDVLSILHHRFAASEINITRRYDSKVRITIPPHELRQIVTNLIANASDAVVGTGPNATVSIQIAHSGDKALLLVEDNGGGIPAANLTRIFDPFFSTKKEVGTGIGLWVTKEIVEKNGGRISVASGNLPSGFQTCFRVEFPLAPPSR